MAKTYQPKKSRKVAPSTTKDVWTQTMLERAHDAFSHDTEQRRKVVEDMKFAFIPGNQWDEHLKGKRRNKPNYECNRIRSMVRNVTGQQLRNKPNIKVRADEDANVPVAEIYSGLIKAIETDSSAETAYDTAFTWAAAGGFGVLGVNKEYLPGDSFDQVLKIRTFMDPMSTWCDPSAKEFDRSDARFWFITELVPRETFKKKWPNAEVVDFDAPMNEFDKDWFEEDCVRIAEYWYIEPSTKTIYLLSDGSVVNKDDFEPYREQFANPPPDPQTGQPKFPPVTVAQQNGKDMVREVEVNLVYSCMVSGKGKLEEPTLWSGTMIPLVPQWGELLSINGEQKFSGMVRAARDVQMIHNFEFSTLIEVVAKLPNSPLRATPAMIKGFETYYERMGFDDPPVLMYNVDPQAPGGSPSREPMAQFPAALANISNIAVEEMKAITNVYDASMGAQGNETSGVAIARRQTQGDIANYIYTDNQVKALKRLGDILVDAIPKTYDAERWLNIIGDDLQEQFVQVNHPIVDPATGKTVIENDLTTGKFKVTVTIGKSFDTARMELAETAQALSRTPGPVGAIGQFMLLKSLDVPGMDEYVQAVRQVLVNQGLLQPGPNDKPPPPPQPNPVQVAQAQHHAGQANLANAKAQSITAEQQAKLQQIEAETAATVAKIPGHEAAGVQTQLQNVAQMEPMPSMGTVPLHPEAAPDLSDQFAGGFPP